MILFYDRDGAPIDRDTWAKHIPDRAYCRVLRTTITSAADPTVTVDVDTAWIGIHHSHTDGPPLIFESVVLDNSSDMQARRYTTESAARIGHADMVGRVAAGITDPIALDATAWTQT